MHKCDCCAQKTLTEKGSYEICYICLWEDDPSAVSWPDDDCNPNSTSLTEAQKNYKTYGASNAHSYWCKTGFYPR